MAKLKGMYHAGRRENAAKMVSALPCGHLPEPFITRHYLESCVGATLSLRSLLQVRWLKLAGKSVRQYVPLCLGSCVESRLERHEHRERR